MTMPYGSAEEPTRTLVGQASVPIHVASSDLVPGKPIGTEHGRIRTIIVANVVGPNSSTPGVQRILNRSLRRYEARIRVNPTQAANTSSTNAQGSLTSPGAGATITSLLLGPGLWQIGWTVELAGTVGAGDSNNFQITGNGLTETSDNPGVVGNFPQPNVQTLTGTLGVQTVAIKAIAAGTVGAIYSAQIIAVQQGQPVTDGVIIGSREELTSGQTLTPGLVAGFLNIGDSLVYKAQPELWVGYPVTNIAPVYVTVSDFIWASDPESAREQGHHGGLHG